MPGMFGLALLAQTDGLLQESFWPVVILLCVAAAGSVLIAVARRWSRSSDLPAGTGFTLDTLRSLKESGAMSEQEFQQARNKIAKSQSAQFLSPSKTDAKPKKPER
jgi:hypothetical protein